MNFYKHHIGDYAQATGHLTFVEDAAYNRLLRKYYAEERAIPGDLKAAQRLVGARTREERDAVETVLIEFFTHDPVENVWKNKRAEEELAKWRAQADANRRVAEEREARKRARTDPDSRTIRADAGNDSSNESSNESFTAAIESREPNQKPEARSQKEAKAPHESSTPLPPSAAVSGVFEGHAQPRPATNPAAEHAIALNRAGFRCTAMNPDLVAFVQAGGTVEHLLQTAELPSCQSKPATYVIRTARRELDERVTPVNGATRHATDQPRESLVDRAASRAARIFAADDNAD